MIRSGSLAYRILDEVSKTHLGLGISMIQKRLNAPMASVRAQASRHAGQGYLQPVIVKVDASNAEERVVYRITQKGRTLLNQVAEYEPPEVDDDLHSATVVDPGEVYKTTPVSVWDLARFM